MRPEEAVAARQQLLRDGYCVIPEVLPPEMVSELRQETDRLNATLQVPGNKEYDPTARYQGTHLMIGFKKNEVYRRLQEHPATRQALEELGLGDFKAMGFLIVLTKEPQAPALYWHQDWMRWDDPLSISPWPQTIALNYYLEDTTIESGCLKVLPGTHLKRIPLHDELVPAHEQGARFVDEDHPVMFQDHPDQVDVLVKAGSLVLNDARVLHAARKNQTQQSRDLLLIWHHRPDDQGPPKYWTGEVPFAIRNRAQDAHYEFNRVPGFLLQPSPPPGSSRKEKSTSRL